MEKITFKKLVKKDIDGKIPSYTFFIDGDVEKVTRIITHYSSTVEEIDYEIKKSLNKFQRLIIYSPFARLIKFEIKISSKDIRYYEPKFEFDRDEKIITLYYKIWS